MYVHMYTYTYNNYINIYMYIIVSDIMAQKLLHKEKNTFQLHIAFNDKQCIIICF